MLICSVLNNQGFQNTKATIREKLTELKHIMTRENLSKEAILENLETNFLVPDNSQFLCIFIHIFLFLFTWPSVELKLSQLKNLSFISYQWTYSISKLVYWAPYLIGHYNFLNICCYGYL